jgi:hypothetical protein
MRRLSIGSKTRSWRSRICRVRYDVCRFSGPPPSIANGHKIRGGFALAKFGRFKAESGGPYSSGSRPSVPTTASNTALRGCIDETYGRFGARDGDDDSSSTQGRLVAVKFSEKESIWAP